MHPQLSSEKRIACKEFIEALEACHASTWAKWTGGCNQAKLDLNSCLHQHRADNAAKNREAAKKRRDKTNQAWKDLHEDE
ncbi:COX assembly mitochondrial protein [Abortiporus biennis]